MNPKNAWALGALVALLSPAAAQGQSSVRAGSTVEFDLSGLPSRFEGGAKAICTGSILTATGPTPSRCERTFRFEVPPGGTRLTYVFRATAGGRETRVDLPVTRTQRPVTFTVPSDGMLKPPDPATIPPEAAETAAAAAAERACRACQGGDFTVESFEVTDAPKPADGKLSVKLRITPPAR